jgi:hypothetical protein
MLRIVLLPVGVFLMIVGGPSTESLRVAIVAIPGGPAITRPMQGDYAQHAQAAQELRAFIGSQPCRLKGFVFGEYPDDPGKVGMANVHWTIGFQVTDRRKDCAIRSAAPYGITDVKAVTAATITTTLYGTKEAGLALLRWLPDSGYVQDGPTRIEYLDDTGAPESTVRLVLPIKKRVWP